MKRIFILSILLLCAIFFSCTGEPPPQIENITYNSTTQTIEIKLSADNRVDLTNVRTKISLTKGGFTGDDIDFIITGTVPGDTYQLNGFSPALQSGQKYYLVFKEGAFGNYGQWSFGGMDDKSDPGAFEFTA